MAIFASHVRATSKRQVSAWCEQSQHPSIRRPLKTANIRYWALPLSTGTAAMLHSPSRGKGRSSPLRGRFVPIRGQCRANSMCYASLFQALLPFTSDRVLKDSLSESSVLSDCDEPLDPTMVQGPKRAEYTLMQRTKGHSLSIWFL